MNRQLVGAVAAAALLNACSADSNGSGGCKIEGTYAVTSKRTGGTCAPIPNDTTPATQTFIVTGSSAEMSTQGVTGTCPGKVDGCTVTFVCEYTNTSGATVATENSSYDFGSKGFTATSALGLRPPAVPSTCTADYALTGIRK